MATAEHRLHQARALQDDGRFLAAADLLLEGFRSDPSEAVWARELGYVLHAAGDVEGAACYLLRAHHADPADPATTAELATVLCALGRGGDVSALLAGRLDPAPAALACAPLPPHGPLD